jgi:hypothetical protein
VIGVGAVAGAAVVIASADGGSSRSLRRAGSSAMLLPSAPAPRPVAIPAPRALAEQTPPVRWAPVAHRVVPRTSPHRDGRTLRPLGVRTPEGTANLVLVVGHPRTVHGRVWIRARLPGRRGAIGWLPRSALGGYTVVHTRMVVDRRRLTATLFRDGRPVLRVPIGIGRPSAPTPAGRFYIRDRLTRYRAPMYGPVAFGTSAQAPGVTDWPAGGFVGIHGTDEPGLIPGRVSHGCIRMRNADIVRLAASMPVGTPVTIR